jgi:type IV pilus assembly protein PilX
MIMAATPLRVPPRQQRGMVLFVALIVMVALSLASVALIRSVDTTTSVAGNLAFRQASILKTNWAVEDATAKLFADATPGGAGVTILNRDADDATKSYWATLQPGESTGTVPAGIPRGIPAMLHKKVTSPLGNQAPADKSLNEVRWVIERVCNAAGVATVTNCDMMPPKQGFGTTIHDMPYPDLPRVPFYRLTVRIDGPQNTVSFAQAMLR